MNLKPTLLLAFVSLAAARAVDGVSPGAPSGVKNARQVSPANVAALTSGSGQPNLNAGPNLNGASNNGELCGESLLKTAAHSLQVNPTSTACRTPVRCANA
ncbi:hypothetical protein C0993_001715 [Termitomyces sp. T159_Od127]|nr:hypothetical protein C0993_001715 [Termitomyces sp. T159_Od127]